MRGEADVLYYDNIITDGGDEYEKRAVNTKNRLLSLSRVWCVFLYQVDIVLIIGIVFHT